VQVRDRRRCNEHGTPQGACDHRAREIEPYRLFAGNPFQTVRADSIPEIVAHSLRVALRLFGLPMGSPFLRMFSFAFYKIFNESAQLRTAVTDR
jgi:hypothetical protein